MSALNYKQEQELRLKAFMDSLQKQPDWSFATVKIGHGNCILLAKKKYSYDKYRVVSADGHGLKFKTKTHAHVAAKRICELGLEDSGYELGEEYKNE